MGAFPPGTSSLNKLNAIAQAMRAATNRRPLPNSGAVSDDTNNGTAVTDKSTNHALSNVDEPNPEGQMLKKKRHKDIGDYAQELNPWMKSK